MALMSAYLGRLQVTGGIALTSSFDRNPRISIWKEMRKAFGPYSSYPEGYQNAAVAYIPSTATSNSIRAILSGNSAFINTAIEIVVRLAAALEGTSILTAGIEQGSTLASVLQGIGNVIGDTRIAVILASTMDAGARPSSFDIAQEVWQSKASSFLDPTTMGGILAAQDPAALADLIMNDPRFLSVAVYLGLK